MTDTEQTPGSESTGATPPQRRSVKESINTHAAPPTGRNTHDEDAAADSAVQDNLDRMGIKREDPESA